MYDVINSMIDEELWEEISLDDLEPPPGFWRWLWSS